MVPLLWDVVILRHKKIMILNHPMLLNLLERADAAREQLIKEDQISCPLEQLSIPHHSNLLEVAIENIDYNCIKSSWLTA